MDYCELEMQMCEEGLLTNSAPRQCSYCKEHSLFVTDVDLNYRNLSAKEENIHAMCPCCYIEFVVRPMDDLWADYYSGLL